MTRVEGEQLPTRNLFHELWTSPPVEPQEAQDTLTTFQELITPQDTTNNSYSRLTEINRADLGPVLGGLLDYLGFSRPLKFGTRCVVGRDQFGNNLNSNSVVINGAFGMKVSFELTGIPNNSLGWNFRIRTQGGSPKVDVPIKQPTRVLVDLVKELSQMIP